MPSVEIQQISLSEKDPARLWGRYIDVPKSGATSEASAVDLAGWVLGKSSPAVAIEILQDEKVTERLPLNRERPDIAEAFPHVEGAQHSGFRATVSALGTEEHFELGVRAVLGDQSRVPIGAIRGRRRWQSGSASSGRPEEAKLVSVVVPCYNQARFLGEAIESVLEQGHPHFEVVVVDDGSTDNTSEVASRYGGVRCVRQDNGGLAAARNEGIRRSVGEYVVFLDADDRLLPGALEAGLRELEAHPECAFVSGHCRFIGVDGAPLPTPQPTPVNGDHYTALLRGCYIWTPATVMYRRTHLQSAGGFDTSVSPSADYNLYLQLSKRYPVRQHRKLVAEYRRHGTNMTRDPARMLKAESTVLRRQRASISGKDQLMAYTAGLRHSQEHFGDPLVDEAQNRIRGGEWGHASGYLLLLLLYYRTGLFSVLRRLIFGSIWRTARSKTGCRWVP